MNSFSNIHDVLTWNIVSIRVWQNNIYFDCFRPVSVPKIVSFHRVFFWQSLTSQKKDTAMKKRQKKLERDLAPICSVFFHRLFSGRFWREYMDSVTSANITDACRWSHSLFFMSLAPPFSHAAVISGKVSSQRLESGQSLPLFFYDQSDNRQKKTRWKDTILDTIFGPGNGSQIVSMTA